MKFNKSKFKGLLAEGDMTMISFAKRINTSIATMNYILKKEDMKLSFFLMICSELNVEPSVLIKK